MSKPKIAPTARTLQAAFREVDDDGRVRTIEREGALADVEALLPLDQVVICDVHPVKSGGRRFTITGEELAQLLSFREAYNNTDHAVDGASVNLQLQGLAELLRGHYGEDGCQLGESAAYFLGSVLDDLAARLESSKHMGYYRIGLRRAPSSAAKAEAS